MNSKTSEVCNITKHILKICVDMLENGEHFSTLCFVFGVRSYLHEILFVTSEYSILLCGYILTEMVIL